MEKIKQLYVKNLEQLNFHLDTLSEKFYTRVINIIGIKKDEFDNELKVFYGITKKAEGKNDKEVMPR